MPANANVFSKTVRVHELFKAEKFLYPEFLPDRLVHRDAQIEELVYCLSPLSKGGKGPNPLIIGPTGTGKTVAVRFVLSQLQEYSDRVKYIYVNCFEYYSRHAILTELCHFLGFPIPRRGLSTDEVFAKFLEALKKAPFTPLLVLDEFDQLLVKGESSVLYDLVRVVNYHVKPLTMVLISNDASVIGKLDERVRSSLHPQTIHFEPYGPVQLKDILNERVQFAFFQNVVEADVINVAAAHASKQGGDCRIALESVLKAGRLAEKENASNVTLAHLRSVIDQVSVGVGRKKVARLNEQEKLIVQLLQPYTAGLDSGSLLKAYQQAGGSWQERQFRTRLNELAHDDVISLVEESKGQGKTRRATLKVTGTALEALLE